MKVVVILRAVRDPASFTVNRRAEKIFVHREEFICNPADLNALEAALRLPDSVVTAIAYGGAPAEDVLRMARALGAARAALIGDFTLQSADAGRISDALRGALGGGERPDLVLLSDDVLDGDYAQVGARLAQALEWPFVESAWQVEAMEEGALKATVRNGKGFRALAVDLPAVVSVPRDSNRVRYAPAGRVVQYYREADAVEQLSYAAVSAPPHSVCMGEVFPPERRLGEVLDGALPETLSRLAALLLAAKSGGSHGPG